MVRILPPPTLLGFVFGKIETIHRRMGLSGGKKTAGIRRDSGIGGPVALPGGGSERGAGFGHVAVKAFTPGNVKQQDPAPGPSA